VLHSRGGDDLVPQKMSAGTTGCDILWPRLTWSCRLPTFLLDALHSGARVLGSLPMGTVSACCTWGWSEVKVNN
jgi:hypothetical protein